jgi:hypothetical protein
MKHEHNAAPFVAAVSVAAVLGFTNVAVAHSKVASTDALSRDARAPIVAFDDQNVDEWICQPKPWPVVIIGLPREFGNPFADDTTG